MGWKLFLVTPPNPGLTQISGDLSSLIDLSNVKFFQLIALQHIYEMADKVLTTTSIEGLPKIAEGKVRDLYEVDDRTLLFVASDRISAYDVIMKNVYYTHFHCAIRLLMIRRASHPKAPSSPSFPATGSLCSPPSSRVCAPTSSPSTSPRPSQNHSALSSATAPCRFASSRSSPLKLSSAATSPDLHGRSTKRALQSMASQCQLG